MKRQLRIIILILVVGIIGFLASCSSAGISGGSMVIATTHAIDLKTDKAVWATVAFEVMGGLPVPPERYERLNAGCIRGKGRGSWVVAIDLEGKELCAIPYLVTIKNGDVLCAAKFGDNYHATAITDRAILYCSEPTAEA